MASKRAGPADAIVGRAIRVRRLAKGMTQSGLGEQLGVTFQQVQKYEKGMNRIGAGRLLQIAQALGVPVETLLPVIEGANGKAANADDPLALLSDRHAIRLARAYSRISDRRIRLILVRLAEGIAARPRWTP